MKKFVVILNLLLCSVLLAQTRHSRFELGLSGSAGSFSRETKTTYPDYTGLVDRTDSDQQSYFILFARPAYYVIPQVSIEPEVAYTALTEEESALEISVNVAYNVVLKNPKLLPFLFAGYGRANDVSINNMLLSKRTDGLDIPLINLGAGLKTYLGEHVALRVEYRYQNRQYDTKGILSIGTSPYIELPVEQKYMSNIIMFGFTYRF